MDITPEDMSKIMVDLVTRHVTDQSPFRTAVVCSMAFFLPYGFHINVRSARNTLRRPNQRTTFEIPVNWRDNCVGGGTLSSAEFYVTYFRESNQHIEFKLTIGQVVDSITVKLQLVTQSLPVDSYCDHVYKMYPLANFTGFDDFDQAMARSLHFTNSMLKVFYPTMMAIYKGERIPERQNEDRFV